MIYFNIIWLLVLSTTPVWQRT